MRLVTEALGKRFHYEWIFKDLTYEFQGGKTYAVTGPNGSGKSTLLQVLWGQMPPTAGRIACTIGTRSIPVEEIHKHVTIATPYMDLIEEFTLSELLHFHFGMRKIRPGFTITELLKILYLEDSADKFIGNFSSGMKQRVKLGLAFYTQASLLYLDEPGSNLDRNAFNWYLEELKKVPAETLVFIASNDPEEYPTHSEIIAMTELKPARKHL